jgi:di/tricarboxylate transporter
MNWEIAGKLPWHIVLLFGGGFALASGFKVSGLSLWCARQLGNVHPLLLVGGLCVMMTFLTELTSNRSCVHARYGAGEVVLNVIGAVLITVAIAVMGRVVLGIEFGVMPEWARLN